MTKWFLVADAGTSTMHRMALDVIEKEISRAALSRPDPHLPRYPQSVPDLEAHLDELLALARRWNASPEAHDPSAVVGRICQECPHQFPTRYCPLQTGGCVASQIAPQIVRAVAARLQEMNDPSDTASEP
jgi:hypothetical protein